MNSDLDPEDPLYKVTNQIMDIIMGGSILSLTGQQQIKEKIQDVLQEYI